MRNFRKAFGLLLSGLALGGAGCAGFGGNVPHATVGYHAGIFKQSVVVGAPPVTPVLNTTSTGLVGIDHSSSMSALSGPVESAVSENRYRAARSFAVGPLRSQSLPASDCTMDEICARLERIERRVSGPALPPAPEMAPSKRMPPGEPKE